MKIPLNIGLFLLLVAGARAAGPKVIFEDDFEGGPLKPQWTVACTNQGRVAVSGSHGPAAGSGHLIFDDSVADTTYSRSTATFRVDLTAKKNAVLSFKAKNLGDEVHDPYSGFGYNFDGVSVSADDGVNWYPLTGFGDIGAEWTATSLSLDGYTSGSLLVQFSQYDNAPVPIDGIAIDDVSVTAVREQKLVVEAPSLVQEGHGPYTGRVLLSFPMDEALLVGLRQDMEESLVIPPSVVIPAGEVSATFEFSVKDDSVANPGRHATMMPEAEGVMFSPEACYITISDDEPAPTASLVLDSSIPEGASRQATVSISSPLAADLRFTIASDPAGQLSHDSSVAIAAGTTSMKFWVNGVDDSAVDGDVPVTLSLRTDLGISASAVVIAKDDDLPELSLEVPETLLEGGAAQGTVRISAALPFGITIALASGSYRVAVPASVSIPAGEKSVSFGITAPDDGARNLAENISVHAEASAGLGGTDAMVRVLDNEPAITGTLVLPAEMTEGSGYVANAGVFRLSAPADVPVKVYFSGGPRLGFPSYVVMDAGLQEIGITLWVADNYVIDEDVTATLAATCDALPPASASMVVRDNEGRELSVNGTSLVEGTTGWATVYVSGYVAKPLEVTLESANPAALSVPASVVIPAGSSSVSFQVTAVDNAERVSGDVEVGITASAAGFASDSGSFFIQDNDPVKYSFASLREIVDAGNLEISVSALNSVGYPMHGPVSPVEISVISDDPAQAPVALPSLNFEGNYSWTGKLGIPALSGSIFRLRLRDSSGLTADSTPFRLMRRINLVPRDLTWDASGSVLIASVASDSPLHPKSIVKINPETREVTAVLPMSQEPGQLALSSDGTMLYAVLDGEISIARINPSSLTLVDTFAVGTDSVNPQLPLYSRDITTVPGKPERLVIGRRRSYNVYPYDAGVGVYDNGVLVSTFPADPNSGYQIEPSADPAVIYSYAAAGTYNLRRLTIGSGGSNQVGSPIDVGNVYGSGMISDADKLIWVSGHMVDGKTMTPLGRFNGADGDSFNVVRPEIAAGRVYFIGRLNQAEGSFFSAFDPSSLKLVQRLSMQDMSPAGSLVRWGDAGFAFRTSASVVVMEDSPLVPHAPPADLSVAIAPVAGRVLSGVPFEYAITLKNQGPNAVADTAVTAELSAGQTVSSAVGTGARPVIDGLTVRFPVAGLAVGGSIVMKVTVTPDSPGPLSLAVAAISPGVDANMADNNATRHVVAEFVSAQDQVQKIRLDATNLVYDPTRNLLWATTSSRVAPPLGTSLVSINPLTGAIVRAAPLSGDPRWNSIALSGNGRYLYFGSNPGTSPYEVHRYDLSTTPPTLFRIPLGLSPANYVHEARDIEVLDGPGTSFLMVGSESIAMVYDGNVRRAATASYTVDRIERGPTSGTFIANYGNALKRLQVGASGGITLSGTSGNMGSGVSDFRTSGSSALFGSGELINLSNLTGRGTTGTTGTPCLDEPCQRAYLATADLLKIRDLGTGAAIGSIPMPYTTTTYVPNNCVRWGVDGLAVSEVYGPLNIIRTSFAVPPTADLNGDGISDLWAAKYFASAAVDPAGDADGDSVPNGFEYAFATSPTAATANPVRAVIAPGDDPAKMKFRFSRRSGFPRNRYGYEISADLKTWAEATGTESVEPGPTVDGVSMETVTVEFTASPEGSGFLRLRWKP